MINRFTLVTLLLILFHVIAAGQSPQLVDVGGYHLDVVRSGSGTPSVILVGGLGNALDTWAQIVPSAAELSTVVAYLLVGRTQNSRLRKARNWGRSPGPMLR